MKRLEDSYFARVYAADDDPWGFEARWYEKRKYALSLAALPRERYARAFEAGCSFGVLSELLAARCAQLLACELVPAVAGRARRRLASHPHVHVETAAIPEYWPDGTLDLVVLSEVVYYLTPEGVRELLQRLEASLRDDAHVLAVHYRGATDYPLAGDAAHAALRGSGFLRPTGCYEEDAFRLELFTKVAR